MLTNLKKLTILSEIADFLKIFFKLQLIVQKCSLKNRDRSLLFTSYLSTALLKILLYSKTIKNTKKLSVFGENGTCRLYIFLQARIFFDTLIIFLEPIIELITEIFDLQKMIIILIRAIQVLIFHSIFLPDKTVALIPLRKKERNHLNIRMLLHQS